VGQAREVSGVLLIRAVSFNGRPLTQDIRARFNEAGGTIGRGEHSTLVLPDPERFISRTHAGISFQAGGFIITDNSTKNPTILNGHPMGPGSQMRLGEGDRIQIGGYLLSVELAARPTAPAVAAAAPPRDDPWAAVKQPPASEPDPFADLLKPRAPASAPPPAPGPPAAPAGRPDPLADPPRPAADPFAELLKPRAPAPAPPPAPGPPAAPAGRPDPLADPPRPVADPFADLLKPRAPAPAPPPAPGPAAAPAGRPDPLADLLRPGASTPDPFADLLKPRSSAAAPHSPPVSPAAPAERPDPLADLHGRQPSIDEVLGLRPSAGVPDLLSPDRPSGSAELPGSAGTVDPLVALGGVAKQMPPPTVPDHGQEVFTPFVPPPARPDAPLPPRVEAVPVMTPPVAPPSPVVPASPAEPPRPATAGVGAGAEVPALLQALLRGAGIPDSPLLKQLTPETMEAIGALLREAVQGTLDLLRARGLTKSEMRADVTMIMPVDNNPLKFSPTAEAAMMHLLAPHVQGFLPPVRAMKTAYDDLRGHELGILAGMRAAFDEMLARFAPDELKKRLSDPGVLDSLLSASRKAKLWDLFVDRYETIAEETRENFHAAFGKAFRRAYEAQVKQLKGEERQG
jgi:FHA domain-containing protein